MSSSLVIIKNLTSYQRKRKSVVPSDNQVVPSDNQVVPNISTQALSELQPDKEKKKAKVSKQPNNAISADDLNQPLAELGRVKEKKKAKVSQEARNVSTEKVSRKSPHLVSKKASLNAARLASDKNSAKCPRQDLKKAPKKCSVNASDLNSIVYRTTPSAFASVMTKLSLAQKKLLRELGFGSLIGFNIKSLPPKFVYYVVDSFDGKDMVIRTSKGDIKCDEQAVLDVLGIRKGYVDLHSGEFQPNAEFRKQWLSQFSGSRRNLSLATVISRSNGAADFLFTINFLMLFWNTMICSDSNGLLKYDLLNYVSRETKVADIDWCGHLLTKLRYSKSKWNRLYPEKNAYAGPAIFLTFLYLDRTICPSVPVCRQRPVFRNWIDFIEDRVDKEILNGGFGLLELAPDFVEHEDSGEGFVHVSDSNKEGISDEKKEYLKFIEDNLDVVSSMKKVLVDAFKDVAAKFGDDKVFKVCRAKMIDIFSLKDFEGKSGDDDDELASLLVKEGVLSDDAVGDVMQSGDFVDDGIPVVVNQGENEALKGVEKMSEADKEVPVDDPQADVHDKVKKMSEAYKEVDDHLSDEEKVYDIATDQEDELFSKWLCFDQDEVIRDMKEFLNRSDLYSLSLPKRSKMKLRYTPTFHILTQESEEDMSVPPKVVDPEPPSSPTVLQPAFGKRRRRPAPVLQSPYVNAKTPVNSCICHSELCVAMQMFSELDISRTQMVFESPGVYGSSFGMRFMFQSLAPGSYIEAGVIDCWAAVLNFQERSRKPNAVSRLFLNTSILSEEFFESKKKSAKVLTTLFEDNLRCFFGNHRDGMSFRDFDLVFFPLCRSSHFYLLVYDLRDKPALHIIDNLIPEDVGTFNGKYKKVTSTVHKLFSTHLMNVKHPSAQLVKGLKATQYRVKWNTKDNFVDCGVFLMRHMESFKGQSEDTWNYGLPDESKDQKYGLLKLRVRYTAKILTHEINKHAAMILQDAREFSEKYSRAEITKLFLGGRDERKRRNSAVSQEILS